MLVELFEDYPFLERKQICVAFSSDILFEDLDIVREELRRARELGVKIAMLGVGDEYCPVLRLVGMPIDIAVLDSYTMALLEDEERTRLAGTLNTEGCTVELALDRGVLLGGGREVPLCEVEVELKAGSEEDALLFAQRLAVKYGLTQENRSKFRRALELAKES
jgi:hypothetical protein